MSRSTVTRGYGLLEEFLSKKRAKMVNTLIPYTRRSGRILDIGCGNYPLFLMTTLFSEKYGLDKVVQHNDYKHFAKYKITINNYDIENEDIIPFKKGFFDVVTMPAVIEHIDPNRMAKTLKEIYRILIPGGMYILTTPAAWTDNLLRLMAKLRIVSSTEIKEHKDAYSHLKISSILQEANFTREKLRFGYFEMFMNIWATAIK